MSGAARIHVAQEEDVAMRTYDFSPLSQTSIGFDRMFDLLTNNSRLVDGQGEYPPYDIVRRGEEKYRISLAVAGFAPEEIAITAKQNALTVTGQIAERADHKYLYQGIAARPFERHFSLEDYVEVEGASLDNGLLQIDLVRRVPEAMKTRRVEINAHKGAAKNGQKARAVS
jgi:molecular chaperone IbpA